MIYYNEWDAPTAAWLRELIRQGHLPPGEVDERSITEVQPDEIRDYTQWHFFAGIGGWSHALRLAGWADSRPVLTGSPPCQPFSSAGKQLGVADERHLAPAWLALVAALRPPVVFGEQVAAAVTKDNWLDDLLDALEAEGYATGAIVLPACGVGAPHIRQRLWIAARLADSDDTGSQGRERVPECADQFVARAGSVAGGMAQSDGPRPQPWSATTETAGHGNPAQSTSGADRHEPASATHGGWGSPDWLFCRDGKWRPVEPSTFPLVDGVSARVVRLRGYGNAIVPQVAVEVIRELM
jgi:DNA (cytosine-5)-methyltransferase 1